MNHPETPDEDPTFDWSTPEEREADMAALARGECQGCILRDARIKTLVQNYSTEKRRTEDAEKARDAWAKQCNAVSEAQADGLNSEAELRKERDILWSAVAHVGMRIMEDPDMGYLVGSLTDTFQRVAEAIAVHEGKDVEFVKLQMLKAKKQTEENYTPRVVALQERIAELEENRRLSDEGNDPEDPIVGAHGAT